MTATLTADRVELPPAAPVTDGYRRIAADVAARLAVAPDQGLRDADATARRGAARQGAARPRRCRLQSNEQRVLADALAGWPDKYPDLTVHRATPRGGARQALIQASRAAQLVVVGTRGRGGVTGLLLGSVSQAVLHHAACPVTIVPHDRRPLSRR